MRDDRSPRRSYRTRPSVAKSNPPTLPVARRQVSAFLRRNPRMSTVTIVARPERKAIASRERGRLMVALTLRASGARVESERLPLACALVLDVSGSMAGPPLAELIRSVGKLCELAGPQDQLAM